MNYPLRDAALAYLRGGDAAGLHGAVARLLEHYPPQSAQLLMNLMGTHDTPRLLTALAAPDGNAMSRDERAHYTLDPARLARGRALVKLAAALQYCLPGVPCVYYGDEAGVQGYEDPLNRRTYPWGAEDAELLEWYRALGRVRARAGVLAQGGYRMPRRAGRSISLRARAGKAKSRLSVR